MKKILLSLISIGVVATTAVFASSAFFSDEETSVGNTIIAGSIDISAENGPNSAFVPAEIRDMKPSYVRWTRHLVRNVGTNPVRLWKHIANVQTENNGWSEPECTDAGGVWSENDCSENTRELNNIDEYIDYDMYIGGTVEGDNVSLENNWFGGHNVNGEVVIHEDDGITLHDIESAYIYLGTLEPNDDIVVWQSYHMKDETGNWAQTDIATFDIEFYAEQVNGNGPSSTTLLLENKRHATDWSPIVGDGMWGVLKWEGDGATFDFDNTLEAHGLTASTLYSLIYYADPWPGDNPGMLLGTGTSDGSGDLSIINDLDLGYDLPHPDDANYPAGAKIWLVLSSDYDSINHKMIDWNPDEYLFEYNLITYDDTDA